MSGELMMLLPVQYAMK